MKEQYSISDLESLSGIKAHTIRIWEQRYQLFNPDRTDTNIRLYSDYDLKKLLNISTLQRHGWKISKLGKLSESDLHRELSQIYTTEKSIEPYMQDAVEAMIVAALEMDEPRIHQWCAEAAEKLGFTGLVGNVLFPLLRRIGVLWSLDEVMPAQEHFISNLVKMKISAETDKLPAPAQNAKKCIVFTPEGELHEIGILMLNYLLRSHGIHTVYLGQSVPFKNIRSAVSIAGADCLLMAMTITNDIEKQQKYLNQISELGELNPKLLLASPDYLTSFTLPASMIPVHHPSEVLKAFQVQSTVL